MRGFGGRHRERLIRGGWVVEVAVVLEGIAWCLPVDAMWVSCWWTGIYTAGGFIRRDSRFQISL